MTIFSYKLATYLSTGDRLACVGLVGCALEFLGRIVLGLGLGLVFGCMSPAHIISKYVCACVH